MSLRNLVIDRRSAVGLGAGLAAVVGLAGCDVQPPAAPESEPVDETVQIDAAAYDKLVASGPLAESDVVAANQWAAKVAAAGTLRVGGTQTSVLFSLLNEKDGRVRGFDSGLSQLLARYITGKDTNTAITNVTSDTRESVLQNDQVDAVFATYSITDKRKELISFAGPYYSTQQSILVAASNKDINGLADLAGRQVAAQSGSTGPGILEQLAPDAKVQEFKTDEEARNALTQGRVDAYVIDSNMQLGTMVRNPGKYRLAGEPFGPVDNYGIGLPLNSDGVDFVNAFLQKIIDEGIWQDLWKICIGDRAGITEAPKPPVLGA